MSLKRPHLLADGVPDLGTVVGIAGGVIALIAILIGAWAAFRSAWPRRTLYVEMKSAVLLRPTPGLDGGIEVRHNGWKLTEPHVATVCLSSRSDRDIESAAFDGKPLELEFGVPILKLLEATVDAQRAAVRVPCLEVTTTALHLGPALITRRHSLRYVVLVEGRPKFRPTGDLVNVNIREGAPRDLGTKRGLITGVFGIILGMVVNLLMVSDLLSSSLGVALGVVVAAVGVSLIAFRRLWE
jgi:hypothetical protein